MKIGDYVEFKDLDNKRIISKIEQIIVENSVELLKLKDGSVFPKANPEDYSLKLWKPESGEYCFHLFNKDYNVQYILVTCKALKNGLYETSTGWIADLSSGDLKPFIGELPF